MEALVAAVAAGADAVYLGGTRFSARRYAANFDDAALKEAVDYAHARGVAVHVTLNTLVHDTELPAVAAYLLFLYEIGVDAVLVQDAGVLALARRIGGGAGDRPRRPCPRTRPRGDRGDAAGG
jgi:putative protease